MLIGRRLNEYQYAVVVPFGHWDANTGPLRDYNPVPAPQSLALGATRKMDLFEALITSTVVCFTVLFSLIWASVVA